MRVHGHKKEEREREVVFALEGNKDMKEVFLFCPPILMVVNKLVAPRLKTCLFSKKKNKAFWKFPSRSLVFPPEIS